MPIAKLRDKTAYLSIKQTSRRSIKINRLRFPSLRETRTKAHSNIRIMPVSLAQRLSPRFMISSSRSCSHPIRCYRGSFHPNSPRPTSTFRQFHAGGNDRTRRRKETTEIRSMESGRIFQPSQEKHRTRQHIPPTSSFPSMAAHHPRSTTTPRLTTASVPQTASRSRNNITITACLMQISSPRKVMVWQSRHHLYRQARQAW